MQWHASWTQALTDVREFGATYVDVTLRMRVVMSIGGDHFRLELNNRFGDDPVVVGRGAVTVDDSTALVQFHGGEAVAIPAGESRWTDPIAISVRHGDEVDIDMYLPEATPHATANLVGCPLRASTPGDFAGRRDFPEGPVPSMMAPDGSELPLSGPLLRSVEVSGGGAKTVVVCLGDSITAGELAENAAALLPAEAAVAVVNRGLSGNRLRLDAGAEFASCGLSGLSRFDEDVLGTAGVTDVIIELGTNDLGLPGRLAPRHDLPSASQLIDAFEQLTDRARHAGVRVTIATLMPFEGSEGHDEERERTRSAVNHWIRASAPNVIDFDQALRSETTPTKLAEEFNFGDHLHPNDAGQARLAQEVTQAIGRRLTERRN